MSQYFSELKSLVNVELDLSRYATKADLKTITVFHALKFAKKVDLTNLKSNVDKLDIVKLKNVPTNLSNLKSQVDKLDVDKVVPVTVDLSKLSDLVKPGVVIKNTYNAKIKNIQDEIPDITYWPANASLNAKINEVEGEILSITNLATAAALNAKINEVKGEIPTITNLATAAAPYAKRNEIKGEIPNITNLATNTALTAVDRKILSVGNLVKKKKNNTNINEIEKKITDHYHDKYITNPEFNKLTAEKFSAGINQANLASKSDVANFVKKIDFDKKLKDVTSSKNELNELGEKVKAISTKGLTKDLINKVIILNREKYFYLKIF